MHIAATTSPWALLLTSAWLGLLSGEDSATAQPEAATSSGAGTRTLALELYGRTPYPSVSRGLRLAYTGQATPTLEIAYVESQNNLLLTNTRYRAVELRVMRQNAGLGRWGVGLGAREVSVAYDTYPSEPTNETEAIPVQETWQSIDFIAGAGIATTLGGHAVVGSDLISVAVPLKWIKRRSSRARDGLDDDDDPKDYPYIREGFGANMQLLRTYVGVSF
jgi:hypothetical protein